MFKKTLLALALAGAAVGANAATTITNDTGVTAISSQGLPATKATTIKTGGSEGIVLTLKAADNTGIVDTGRLIVNITGAFFANPASATAAVGGALVNETVEIDAAESTSTQLVFDLVKNADDWTVIDNDTITVKNLELIVTGTDIKVDTVFQSNTKIDFPTTAGAAKSVAKVSDQWAAGVVNDVTSLTPTSGKLNNKIDVADNRETFVGGVTSDVLTFDVETSGSGATLNDVTVTVAGDFTGVKSVSAVTGADAAVTYAINTAKTEATYTYAAGATTAAEVTSDDTAVTFALNTVAADVVSIDARSFTVSVDVDYDDAESVQHNLLVLDKASAGAWSLNGTSSTVEYMPYGPNTQMIFQATSTFSEDAMYDISYLNEATGKMVTLEKVGTIKANSVSKLGDDIAAAVMADSGTTAGKTRLVLSVNAPTGDVVFFHAFKDLSDKDRLGVK
jgi:hypothetical protein